MRKNLYCNKYIKGITSVPRNPDRMTEKDAQKVTTVCLPDVKGLTEKIQKICSLYDIRTIFRSGMIL